MELKKLDRSVLMLWYVRVAIGVAAILLTPVVSLTALILSNAPMSIFLAIALSVNIPAALVLVLILILPYLRYRLFAWGYDEKTIVVKKGVIFRRRVVIPVCQIQDLHRTQGPLMMLFKLSSVMISTAGSNFTISTLTTKEADRMIDTLENHLEVRLEEQRNEEI